MTIQWLSLIIAIMAFITSIVKWIVDFNDTQKKKRLDFIYELYIDFSKHNWKFIDNWEFPGVFPNLDELVDVVPEKTDRYKKVFGSRVVTLEHLNILLKVFTYKDLLSEADIEGFSNWANSWYENSQEALGIIFERGDTYPLDFIIWLQEKIFKNGNLEKLFGFSLKRRLDMYMSKDVRRRDK